MPHGEGDGAQDHHDARRYRVRHHTRYAYSSAVDACYERGYLRPRDTATQRVIAHDLQIIPEPDLVSDHVDFFGNHSYYVEIRSGHAVLEVTKESVVEIYWPYVDLAALDAWTVGAAARVRSGETAPIDGLTRTMYALPSGAVGAHTQVARYARTIMSTGMPLGQALQALTMAIRRDFAFRSGVTSVRTTLPELLELRAGVCQDFAHLALGCLRSFGLSARYVSGYIETSPPPGKPKLRGSDASHAWVSVLLPDGAWVDLDPTNSHLADSRYIVTAWGRDYRDVSPLKGVVYTVAASSELTVEVDVTRIR